MAELDTAARVVVEPDVLAQAAGLDVPAQDEKLELHPTWKEVEEWLACLLVRPWMTHLRLRRRPKPCKDYLERKVVRIQPRSRYDDPPEFMSPI